MRLLTVFQLKITVSPSLIFNCIGVLFLQLRKWEPALVLPTRWTWITALSDKFKYSMLDLLVNVYCIDAHQQGASFLLRSLLHMLQWGAGRRAPKLALLLSPFPLCEDNQNTNQPICKLQLSDRAAPCVAGTQPSSQLPHRGPGRHHIKAQHEKDT